MDDVVCIKIATLISEGGRTITHRVAYMDKPLIRAQDLTPKEKSQMFQKHAIKAVAKRPQQRGHPFVSVKPIHTIEKAPKLESVEQELEMFETGLKECVGDEKDATQQDMHSDNEGEEISGKGDSSVLIVGQRKQKGKEKKKPKEMFDLESGDIDNLEKFGTDPFAWSTGKGKGNVAVASPRQGKDSASGQSKSVAILKSFKGQQKPAINELEKLKQELQQIKKLAKTDSLKMSQLESTASPKKDIGSGEKKQEHLANVNYTKIRTDISHVACKEIEMIETKSRESIRNEQDILNADNEGDNTDTDIQFDNDMEVGESNEPTGNKSLVSSDIDNDENVEKIIQGNSESENSSTGAIKSVTNISTKMQQIPVVKNRLRKKSVEVGSILLNPLANEIKETANISKTDQALNDSKDSEKVEDFGVDPFEDDSDNESDGLVIDCPNDSKQPDSPKKRNKRRSRSAVKAVYSKGEEFKVTRDVIDTVKSETVVKDEETDSVDLKATESEEQLGNSETVTRNTRGSKTKSDTENALEKTAVANVKKTDEHIKTTRSSKRLSSVIAEIKADNTNMEDENHVETETAVKGAKRKSTGNVKEDSPTSPKRKLRNSVSAGSPEVTETGVGRRTRARKSEVGPKEEGDKSDVEPETAKASGRGRGRKRVLIKDKYVLTKMFLVVLAYDGGCPQYPNKLHG